MDNIVQTPSQAPSPAPVQAELAHKPNIVRWLLMIIVVALLSSIATLIATASLSNKQPQPTPTPAVSQPTPTPDETANWKIYTNDQYNFSIKYPDGWIVTPYDYKNVPVVSSDEPRLKLIVSFLNKSFTGMELGTPGLIDVGIDYIEPKVPLTEFLTQEKNSDSNLVRGNAVISDKLVAVAGIQAHKVTYKYHNFTNNKVYVPKDESVYIVTSQYLNKDSSLEDEFNKILSTFTFLN